MWSVSVYSRDNLGWHWHEKADVVRDICEYIALKLNKQNISIDEAIETLKKETCESLNLDEEDWKRSWEIKSSNTEIVIIDRMIADRLSWGYIRGRIFVDDRNEKAEDLKKVAEEFIRDTEKFEIEANITPYRPLYCIVENTETKLGEKFDEEVSKDFVEEMIKEIIEMASEYEFKSEIHTAYCNPYGTEDEDWGWSVDENTLEVWFVSIDPPYGGIEERITIRLSDKATGSSRSLI